MYAGHMVEIAPTGELFQQPLHPYTRGLLGSQPHLSTEGRPRQPLRGLLRRQELPPGCPFAPRCDYAEASCSINVQHLESVSLRRSVACQRWQTIAAPTSLAAGTRETSETNALAAQPLLRLEHVSFGYGRNRPLSFARKRPPVVKDLTLSIEAGETLALVGESGSGKSTIARGISGLIAPLAGTVTFQNEALPDKIRTRSNTLRHQIQYVFQNPDASLNPRMKIGEILARPLQVFFHADRPTVAERVNQVLDDIRLDHGYAERYPDQLSGGERQRVAIARAIIADPILLICDEVLSALDVSVQASIIELMRRLRREHHLAMLFISHDLIVVRSLADRVGVLFGGTLVEIGPTAEIFAPPYHAYTLSLLAAIPGAEGLKVTSKTRSDAPPSPQGCVFAARCPWHLGPICDREPPPWRTIGGLNIRCHIPTDRLTALGAQATEGTSLGRADPEISNLVAPAATATERPKGKGAYS
jgi:peptide/nickel transport system ATP-binding protein